MRVIVQLTLQMACAGLVLAACNEPEKQAAPEHGASAMDSHRAVSASGFDGGMSSVLSEYLVIQAALANDETEGVHAAAEAIENAAAALDPASAAKEHAEHYRDIPKNLASAARALNAATDLAAARSAFEALSKPVSVWVAMARPGNAVLMYCPMKKVGWVQADAEVSNPYGGPSMKRCGERVDGQGGEDEHSHSG